MRKHDDILEQHSSAIVSSSKDVVCYLLEDSSMQVNLGDPVSDSARSGRGTNNCKYDQFGRDCVPCKIQSHNKNCIKSVICDENSQCYCSPGYTGRNCQNECSENKYGLGCLENCGHCKSNRCGNRDGYCTLGCEDGYSGYQCKTGTTIRNLTSASSKTLISLTWSPPEGVEIGKLKYIIHSRHDNYLECTKSFRIKGAEIAITTYEEAFVLSNLIPRSTYKITITAYEEETALGITETFVDTQSSLENISDLKMPNIYVTDIVGPFIVIQISDLNCTETFYPLFYSFQLKCADMDCKDELYSKCIHHRAIRESISVKPFSNYSWVFALAKINCSQILQSVENSIQTAPSSPGPISEFYIYAFSKTKVSFRWSDPFPPNGILERYTIRKVRRDIMQNISLDNIKCKLWPEMSCFDWFESWAYRVAYNFELSAWNENVNQPSSKDIQAIMSITELKPPKNLTAKYIHDNRDLYLQWLHPDMVSGEIILFVVYINGTSYDVPIVEFNQVYNYTIPESQESFTTLALLHISVVTKNNYNKASLEVKGSVYVPPKLPKLSSDEFTISNYKEDNIQVNIPTLINIEGDDSYLLIVVSCGKSDCPNILFNTELNHYFATSNLSEYYNSWIAKELNITHSSKEDYYEYIIGTNSSENSKYISDYKIVDRTFKRSENIAISVILVNKYLEYERSNIYTIYIENNAENSFAIHYIYLLLIVVIAIIGLLIYRHRSRKMTSELLRKALRKLSVDEDTESMNNYEISIHNGVENLVLSNVQVDTSLPIGSKVPFEHFEKYTKDLICLKQLENEFNSIPKSGDHPCIVGGLPENKAKNRYGNLLPYDHSRILLNEVNNDPFSNYINANLIQGYKACKGYIATQGPKKTTLSDFWRMIWEQDVTCVVMVTNCIENEKHKCFQYWPNNDSCISAGNFKITHGYSVVFADYTERLLAVLNANQSKTREVRHLHFTSWPDHGTPLYPQTLSPFIRVVNNISQENAPIVVHCSAGVGRTGTIILIDLCLRMAQGDSSICVSDILKDIRKDRSNLVGNAEQYELVYMVLLDMLFSPISVIQCDATFLNNVSNVLKNNEHVKLYTYLNDIAWLDELHQLGENGQSLIVSEKNRFSKILADDNFRVFLSPLEGSTYINAVYVDGFKTLKQFVATQHPMKSTVDDFWRMIVDTNCKIIISLEDIDLDDDTCCPYWPSETYVTMQPFKNLYLEYKTTDDSHAHYDEIKVEVKHKRITTEVTIMHVKKWRKDLPHPNSKTLVFIWSELIRKMIGSEGVVVVVCRDGAYRCGLFLAQCFLLEKIKLEHECDVGLATRVVRRSRPQFLKDIRQFQFLYQLAKTYYEEFEAYANFN